MSVLTPRRRRYTALERKAMTPEQELELLIAEQEADDTYRADTPRWSISLDATHGHGYSSDRSVGSQTALACEMVGRDPWPLVDDCLDLGLDPAEVAYRGDLVDELPPPRGLLAGQGLIDTRAIPHATAGGYQNHKCRCIPCTNAWAAYKRERRALRKAAA